MSPEITVNTAVLGITLHIKLDGEDSIAQLMHGQMQLTFVCFDDSTPPHLKFVVGGWLRINRAYFFIAPDEAPRLQAWLTEVHA